MNTNFMNETSRFFVSDHSRVAEQWDMYYLLQKNQYSGQYNST